MTWRALAKAMLMAGAALAWGALSPARAQTPASLTGGAGIERASFDYQRRIPAGISGVASLRLDLQALAHSRLADVRLVTDDGFQVPYLIEDDGVPLRVVLPPLVPVSEPEISAGVSQRQGHVRTVYAIAFPLAGMPPSDLVLETGARVFEREVSVLVKSEDPRRRDSGRWQTAAWGAWRHTDPDTPAAPLILALPALRPTSGRVVVDEGDNRPLPIAAPTLELRTCRLRFMRETSAGLWLVYGKAGLTAPRYDLALLEPRLRTTDAAEVTAGPERPSSGPETEGRRKALFWGVLIVAIVALLALVARLLRVRTENGE